MPWRSTCKEVASTCKDVTVNQDALVQFAQRIDPAAVIASKKPFVFPVKFDSLKAEVGGLQRAH